MRGDVNRDFHFGDAGTDTVSYATATPPGPSGRYRASWSTCRPSAPSRTLPQPLVVDADPGQGAEEVKSVENVIGSEFDDALIGGRRLRPRARRRRDLLGVREPRLRRRRPLPRPASRSRARAATPACWSGAARAPSRSPSPRTPPRSPSPRPSRWPPAPGCASVSAGTVTCAAPAAPLGYATVWSGGGGDEISLGHGLPGHRLVVLDGGEGSDTIDGSPGSEILLAGPSGVDGLSAAGGDDALICGPGGDAHVGRRRQRPARHLAPCDGHDMSGGAGRGDIAGFGQTSTRASSPARRHGVRAGRRRPARRRRSRADNEVLEGTQNDDVLYGTAAAEPPHPRQRGRRRDLRPWRRRRPARRARAPTPSSAAAAPTPLEAFDGSRDAALNCGAGRQPGRPRPDRPARAALREGREEGEAREEEAEREARSRALACRRAGARGVRAPSASSVRPRARDLAPRSAGVGHSRCAGHGSRCGL